MSKLSLSEQAHEARREYQRKWRRNNPDKIRQYHANYWERLAASIPIETRVLSLYRVGYSLREIAEQLNTSHMTVKRIIDREK